MIEIGRLCVKIAGRDAGRKCVIVDIADDNFVVVDGDVRRKRCNIDHLEPLNEVVKLRKGASHEVVAEEFKKMQLHVWETKPKQKVEKAKAEKKTTPKAKKK